jgi:hypothetical protein
MVVANVKEEDKVLGGIVEVRSVQSSAVAREGRKAHGCLYVGVYLPFVNGLA